MEPCSICGREMEEEKAEEKVVVVKDVPAWVCMQCGERYYSINKDER